MRSAKSLRRMSLFLKLYKKSEYEPRPDIYLDNFTFAYVGRFRVGNQKLSRHHVFRDVYHTHVDEACAIQLFECSRVAE